MNQTQKYQPKPVHKAAIRLEKGKLPPQAVELEAAVLGALLIERKAADELFQVFTSEEVFYKDAHKAIFKAIKRLSDASSPIDILTVSNQLKIDGNHSVAGGDHYLIQLTQSVASSAHIEFHARIVLQAYMKRKVISICSEAIQFAYDADTDVFSLLDMMDTESTAINEIIARGRTEMSFSDALDRVVDRVKMLTDATTTLTGVETGFAKLNKHFGGWQPTDFIVIGARPGMGKTAFVIRTTVEAAKSGSPVGFVSLEMSTEQLVTRSVAIESSFHMNQLTKSGFEKQEYFSGLLRKVNEMRNLPIYIDDRPSLTIGEIKRKARLMKRKQGIRLLVVDYIQLAGAEGNEDDRVRVGKISRGLKSIAKELEITVIGLAQLSREVEKTATKRPALHHLKESGDIEQDADAVCFLFRPGYYGLEPDHDVIDQDCNTEFIIAKYRHGGVGTYGLSFDENKTKFMDRHEEEPANGYPAGNDGGNQVPLPKIEPSQAFGGNWSIQDQSDNNPPF